jgi:excisionase family DNA binding protein
MPATPLAETRLLTMEQVAGILTCSTKTVRRLTRAGKLQCMVLDKRELRFRREWVDAYIDRNAPER